MTRVQVQYFRAAEVQARGALHFHLLVRMPEHRGALLSERALVRLAVKHGFGHELRLDTVSDERAAGYVAKYVSKACSERSSMPWVDVATGEACSGNGRYRVWTSSRKWGFSMGAVRAQQAEWATRTGRAPDPEGRSPAATGPALSGLLDLGGLSYATVADGVRKGVGL